jgi:glycerophosphoryl diester phosphodiesterase
MHLTYRQRTFRILLVASVLVPRASLGEETRDPVKPLLQAHAHNDYEHPRPLLDALDQGFTSVEADVYLVDGELLVAHHWLLIKKERTLKKLYLEPLRQRTLEFKGRVFEEGPALTLLVDIKRDGAAAYAALHQLLAEYREIISVSENGVFEEKAVTVIVSGDRASEEIAKSNPRYVGIDGRLGDLSDDRDASLLPLISDNWSQHFAYRGTGTMTDAERTKLMNIVSRAHSKGRRIRFWGTPEYEKLWMELESAGVDLIGTDDLKRLATFLQK